MKDQSSDLFDLRWMIVCANREWITFYSTKVAIEFSIFNSVDTLIQQVVLVQLFE